MDSELSKRVKAIVADTFLVYDSCVSADKAFDSFILNGETRQTSIFKGFRETDVAFLKEDMSLMYDEILNLLCEAQHGNVCSNKKDV